MQFLAQLSPKRTSAGGKVLGTLAYCLDNRHRRIVRRNLVFTYPQWSRNYIREVTRRVFQNTVTTLLEILQIMGYSKADIRKRVRIEGEENLQGVIKSPTGTILISAHLGNWELAHLAVSAYADTSILLVARHIRPDILDRALNKIRNRFGNIVVDKKKALPRMARRLHRGQMLGLLIDQEPKHARGVDVTFFGKPTAITPGPAILARRYGSPILPVFCVRDRGGNLTLVIEPPIRPIRTKHPDTDLHTNMQAMSLAIEKAIRSYPDQWFWFHKRWKHHFAHLYKEDLNRLRRRRARKKRH